MTTKVGAMLSSNNIDAYAIPSDGWIAVTDSWSYASATTITIPSDGTTKYEKGYKFRWKQGGGYKYGVAASVAATLLTLIATSDYSVANSAITDIYYSPVEYPYGFPHSFNYTLTLSTDSGSITSYTVNTAKYHVHGQSIEHYIDVTITNNGTGAAVIRLGGQTGSNLLGYGREGAITGKMIEQLNNGLTFYDNTYPGGTNYRLFVKAWGQL